MQKKAFTIIELLVAIAIIAILTTLGIASYNGVRERARDAQRSNDLNQLKINLTTYYQSQNPQRFPVQATKTAISPTSGVLFTALVPGYARALPVDPVNTGDYTYKYQTDATGLTFTLFGSYENRNNKAGWNGGTQWVADGYRVTSD